MLLSPYSLLFYLSDGLYQTRTLQLSTSDVTLSTLRTKIVRDMFFNVKTRFFQFIVDQDENVLWFSFCRSSASKTRRSWAISRSCLWKMTSLTRRLICPHLGLVRSSAAIAPTLASLICRRHDVALGTQARPDGRCCCF